ncbi:hypothetical protein ABZP36_011987 [Zizania latifolia]
MKMERRLNTWTVQMLFLYEDLRAVASSQISEGKGRTASLGPDTRLVRDKRSKDLVAVKYIERGSKIDENVQREIINHMSLWRPNILQFKEVGRMAGQFAKPRSNPAETIDRVTVLSYRGDIINSNAFDEKSRSPDPERLIRAYSHSASTLSLLREFAHGGYADLQRVTQWNLDFLRDSRQGDSINAPCGLKTRSFDAIRGELRAFFDVLKQEGSHPGLLRDSLGDDRAECIGGSKTMTLDDSSSRYHTPCDPRLNALQSLELAFAISERLSFFSVLCFRIAQVF